MKWPVIAAIVLAATVNLTPRSNGEEHAANPKQQSSEQATSSDNQKHPTGETSSTRNETPPWYKSPEWILVIVGCITAIVIGYQSWATMRAAKATEEMIEPAANGASAALSSAQALVNAERPWISARIVKRIEDIPRNVGGMRVAEPTTFFEFVLTNNGRTPALITSVQALPRVSRDVDGGFDETAEPDYGLPAFLRHIRLLAPNEQWIYEAWMPHSMPVMMTTERDEVIAGTKHVLYWGVVLYTDQFAPDKPHETRFCYTYFMDGSDEWRPSGPRQYTKYT